MERKVCRKCGKSKLIGEFSKRLKGSTYGYRSECKDCRSGRQREYRRTEEGIIREIYNSQKQSSKERGHKPPLYNFESFKAWVIRQDNWDDLYVNWAVSNFGRMEKPSIDRLNNLKGYSFSNIRLVTWSDNLYNASMDRRNGKLGTMSSLRPVVKSELNGEFVCEYISIQEAHRKTGIDRTCISGVCRGKNATAGGFTWRYK